MLARSDTLLCGCPADVFSCDSNGHELHVDRRLNVLGSGAMHVRYFQELCKAVGCLFDQRDIESQPLYVCDMGCVQGVQKHARQLCVSTVYRTVLTRGEFAVNSKWRLYII